MKWGDILALVIKKGNCGVGGWSSVGVMKAWFVVCISFSFRLNVTRLFLNPLFCPISSYSDSLLSASALFRNPFAVSYRFLSRGWRSFSNCTFSRYLFSLSAFAFFVLFADILRVRSRKPFWMHSFLLAGFSFLGCTCLLVHCKLVSVVWTCKLSKTSVFRRLYHDPVPDRPITPLFAQSSAGSSNTPFFL